MPRSIRRMLPYPADLFRVQAQELQRSPWRAGDLVGRPAPAASEDELPRTATLWGAGETGPVHQAVYDHSGGQTVATLVVGDPAGGRNQLVFYRLDSTATIPSRGVLERRWARFPSYDMLNDSVGGAGSRTDASPVRYERTPGGVVAYQATYGHAAAAESALVWVSVAASGDRLGAGRSFEEAWNNLAGITAPLPAGMSERDRLQRARDWFARADSAVRRGNWNGFGAAWRELQRTLGRGEDSATP